MINQMAKKRILVVDDEAEMVESVCHMLRRFNYEVIGTTQGKQAVELAQSKKPDLIILDMVMPDMQGGEVAAVLSRQPETAGIPIMFLTALLVKKDKFMEDKIRGKYYVLAKPVTAEELLEAVDKAMSVKVS